MIDLENPIISMIGNHMSTKGAKDIAIDLSKSEN